MNRLKLWLHWLLALAYPQECFFCGTPTTHGFICANCLKILPLRRNAACHRCGKESTLEAGTDFICDECLLDPPAFDRAVPAVRYAGAMRDLIHHFKYQHGLWLVSDLVLILQAAYIENFVRANIQFQRVVPVPMLAEKRRHRGFNQAELLAMAFARSFKLPYDATLLKRIPTGVLSQTSLHRNARKQHALKAYVIDRKADLTGENILIIDDVMTTGATCHACAKLLKQQGAHSVYVLTLARGFK